MSNPFHFSVGVSVGPFSAGVDVGELIDLVFNRKVNENGEPILEFTYKNRTSSMRVPKRKFLLRRKLDAWYRLLPDKDFEVRVRNTSTGQYSAEQAKAIKLFLSAMREKTAVYGLVRNYLSLQNELTDFVFQNKSDKASDDVRLKYCELYFELLTIARILTPPRAYLPREECFVKVYLPQNDFHFSIELQKSVSEKFDVPFGIALGETNNVIVCEQVIPAFYRELGCRSNEFLVNHPEIFRLENYYLSSN